MTGTVLSAMQINFFFVSTNLITMAAAGGPQPPSIDSGALVKVTALSDPRNLHQQGTIQFFWLDMTLLRK